MAVWDGLEPSALALTVPRSTIELPHIVAERTGFEPIFSGSKPDVLPLDDLSK